MIIFTDIEVCDQKSFETTELNSCEETNQPICEIGLYYVSNRSGNTKCSYRAYLWNFCEYLLIRNGR
jgi:hypothetical protein